jgi:hypothetical protein
MSWSFAVPAAPAEHFEANAADAQQHHLAANPTLIVEAAQQIDEVIEAAVALVKSGAVGDGTVQATLTGHANPGHRPAAGWSNDSITIALYSVDAPATVPAADPA